MMGGPGLLLLPLLAGLGAAVSGLEPLSNIRIVSQKGHLSATWEWRPVAYNRTDVNFTVFYQELGMAAIEIPGCVHIDQYVCHMPSELLDFSKNYTLHVRAETPSGDEQSASVGFQPSLIVLPEQLPPPVVYLVFDDGLVTVCINTSVDPVYASYIVILQNMNTSAESQMRPTLKCFNILYKDLRAGVTYCLRAQVNHSNMRQYSPFSAASCFTPPKGLPENLRVEGINTIYILKWDWDFEKNPNVTFSVEKSFFYTILWRTLEGCENITALECNVTGLDLIFTYNFRVSVYNSETGKRSANIATFNPVKETVIGPPTYLNLSVQNNVLHITVVPPDALHYTEIRQDCTWENHLERWKNSTPIEVITMQNSGIHFTINDVEASTTYCARAYTKCKENNRTGLYSQIYCTATAARSFIKEWIIGSVFVAIIVVSAILYICLCPLKRYLRHIFFPKSKLPSSIEKSLQDSPRHYIKNFFLLHEEEATDKCYIMQNSPVDAEAGTGKKSLAEESRDSGNYSNEDEVRGDSSAAAPAAAPAQ